MAFASGPELGGIANIPAVLIIGVVAGMLIFGTKESATVNAFLVIVKLLALIMFVVIALGVFNAANFDPFMPMGFSKQAVPGPDGTTVEVGVMAAAAIIFFAFYGFDAIATASEEAKNPDRDLAIGIVGSMVVCVIIYMLVAAAAIGALATTVFADSPEPLALILRGIGQPTAANLLALSAAIALPTVILAFFFGQSRIFLAMARDGLLPEKLAHVSKRGTPTRITIFTAIVVSVIAALFPLSEIAALANAGTLTAFIAVCAAMMFLRRKQPDAPRKFRAPAAMLIGSLGIIGCIYLLFSLPTKTQEYFIIWNLIGIVVYWIYGSRQAAKARAAR
jgi:basic amino acid/polyamine antiporter, APA family